MSHLNIAILGDVHGHLTLAYRILKRWEREEEQTLDLILQVGDFGAFPPPYRLDKATRRFAEHDPDELGFTAYFNGEAEAEEILGTEAPSHRKIEADFVFIRGNHEDFEYLASLDGSDGPVAIDAFQKIYYLKSGVPFQYTKGEHSLCIAGLGGISDDDGQPAKQDGTEIYTKTELKRLSALGRRVDIFMSHEPPLGAAASISARYEEAGSPAVREFIHDFQPAYHFCGHYHEAGQALFTTASTRSYQLNAVNFWKPNRLNPGCIGVLQWQGRTPLGFSLLEAEWLREYNKNSFRYL